MLVLFEGEFGARQTQRFIEETLHVGHWSWDLDSGEMEWSRGLYDLLGVDPGSAKISSLEFDKVIHPEDRHRFADAEPMLRHSIPVEREFRIIISSGRLRWIMLRAEPIAGNLRNPVRAVGICHDITRHREDLLLLQQTEQRLRSIAQLSGALNWVARPDGALMEFLNLPEQMRLDEFVVRPNWTRLVHPNDAEKFRQVWQTGLEKRQRIALEHRMLEGNGRYFRCWSIGAPIFDSVGNIKEWIGISRNLSCLNCRPQVDRGRLTAAQVRAARAILNWSVERLSKESGVRPGTIRRLEEFESSSADAEDLEQLERTLAVAGIEFVFLNGGKPGVRPR
jgi:PAS domain S-box-containing protein